MNYSNIFWKSRHTTYKTEISEITVKSNTHFLKETHVNSIHSHLVMNNNAPQLTYSKCSLECLDMTWPWQVIYYSSHSRVPSPSYIHRQTLKRVTVCIFVLVTPPFPQHHMCVLGCLFITSVSPPHPIAFLTKETYTYTYTHTHIYI